MTVRKIKCPTCGINMECVELSEEQYQCQNPFCSVSYDRVWWIGEPELGFKQKWIPSRKQFRWVKQKHKIQKTGEFQ